MDVISVRVPSELKKAMKEIDINWSEEIRKFIEKKVREYGKVKALEEIDSMLSDIPEVKVGTAKDYVLKEIAAKVWIYNSLRAVLC